MDEIVRRQVARPIGRSPEREEAVIRVRYAIYLAIPATKIIEGGGEEMPSALENLLPGYEDFPTGRTLDPVDSLKTLSPQDKLKFLLEKLPELRAVGWITDEAAHRYEKQMNVHNTKVLLDQLDADLQQDRLQSR